MATGTPAVLRKPIVYGNVATPLPKTLGSSHTHTWRLFLRSPNNEDLSPLVNKVVFKLHESFNQPTRVFEKPPYELSESGWGEFDVQIRIYFHDPTLKPVSVTHTLKLYPNEDTVQQDDNLISQTYDELVFTNPSPALVEVFTAATTTSESNVHYVADYAQMEQQQLKALATAKGHILKQIQEQQQRYQAVKAQAAALRQTLGK